MTEYLDFRKLPRYLKAASERIRKRRLVKSIIAHRNVAGFILARNKYGAYCIPASAAHRVAAQYVLAGDVWEADTVEFMVTHAKGGDVITAGTFFGDFLPALSAATAPHGTVWAFEPNPESHRCAAITVLLNDLRNVRLTNAALGETLDTKSLVVRDLTGQALGGGSRISDLADREGGTDTVPVTVVAIDDVVPNTAAVSIFQLDVEGFEEFALAGATNTIKRSRPLLILETVPKPELTAGQFLASLRYRVTRRLSENVVLECD